MNSAPRHLSDRKLSAALPEVVASPRDAGRLEAIVVRPAANDRHSLTSATLSPELGIDGDRWATDSFYRLENGQPDPRNQVSLMNARLLRLIAGHEEAICLAGDNLIVDLDLSEANLPAGSRLAIGSVVLELTDLPHTGCTKFSSRYGQEACLFVNSPQGKQLHLRGRYAQIVAGGTISIDDTVSKCSAPAPGPR
jgi:MOSC domain